MKKQVKISWTTLLFIGLYLIGIVKNIMAGNYIFVALFSLALIGNIIYVLKGVSKR